MKAIGLKGSRVTQGLTVFGVSLLLVGLVAIAAIKKSEVNKTSIKSPVDKQVAKVVNTQGNARLLKQERVIPDSDKITIDQAKNNAAVKFLEPKALPNGAKLEAIFYVPNQASDGSLDKKTIAQRYDINGKYLEIWAAPKAQAPDYKRIADEGTVKVPDQNPDGSVKTQADGSIKWVRKDNTKLVTVNGMLGNAGEPNQVKGPGIGVVDNPGTLYWWANGTEYSMWALNMPVSDMLKIAESMK